MRGNPFETTAPELLGANIEAGEHIENQPWSKYSILMQFTRWACQKIETTDRRAAATREAQKTRRKDFQNVG